jgi:hypothetical protein
MQERRSRERLKWKSLLKDAIVVAQMRIPSGWSASLTGDRFDFNFSRSGDALWFDPYLVRDRFLNAIETPQQALAFFRKFGPLDVQGATPGTDVPPGAAGAARSLSFAEVQEMQDLYKKALMDPKYFHTARNFDMTKQEGIQGWREFARMNLLRAPTLTIQLQAPPRPPFLLALSAYASQAIYTSIYLDMLSGLKSVRCAWCHKIARQNNQHFQRFCTKRCGSAYRKEKYLKSKEKSDGQTRKR